MKMICKYVVIYLCSIILFGVFYWTAFQFYPDSFIFNEQTNLRPFSSNVILGEDINSLIYYQKKADSLRTNKESHKRDLQKYTQLVDSIKPISKDAYNNHEKIRAENIVKWKIQNVPDSLTKKSEQLEQRIKTLSEHEKKDELEIANLKVEKAKNDYELAKKEVVLCDFVLKNYAYFSNELLVSNFLQLDSLINNYELDIIPNITVEIRKFEYEIEQLKFDALNKFRKRISMLDFLLFSASNSTTITYGDIIPNNSFVKIILFIQAMSCIILLGLLVAKIKT